MDDQGYTVGTATLYTALARLRESGTVEEVDAPDDGADARRRYYRLTASGRRRIEAEATRLEALLELTRRAPDRA